MRSRYIGARKLARLQAAMKPEEWLPFEVSLSTGLRIGDVVSLSPVNVYGDHLLFCARKTGKIGYAPISPELARALIKSARGGRWCFPGRRPGKHLTRQACWARIKRACRACGAQRKGVSPHSMRKVFAVRSFARTGDLTEVQNLLQHRYIGDTALYALSDKLKGK